MPASDPKVTKEIHALEHEYEHLFNTGNIDRLVDTFYAPDVRLLAPHEPILEGRKAVRKGIQEMVGSYSELRIHPGEVHVSGDLAAAQGRFSAKVSLPDGSTMEDEGKFLEVFRRQPDGQWACFLDAFSSDMAPPSMADAPATQAAEPSPVAELKELPKELGKSISENTRAFVSAIRDRIEGSGGTSTQHVVPRGDQWAVIPQGSSRPGQVFERKEDALNAGRAAARKQKGVLVVHRQNGTIQEVRNYKET